MEIKINRESRLLFVSSAEHCQSRTARWTAHVIGMYVSREQPIGLELNGHVFFFFRLWLSGVSKQMRDRTLPIFTWLKACACVVKSLKSQCRKVSSEKIHCNGVNVHLYKFLKLNIQPFKTYFSMYEHLFAFTRFQNRETMKYTVRTVPDLKLCKCAGDIVWTLKTCLWKKKNTLKMCWWKWWRR